MACHGCIDLFHYQSLVSQHYSAIVVETSAIGMWVPKVVRTETRWTKTSVEYNVLHCVDEHRMT